MTQRIGNIFALLCLFLLALPSCEPAAQPPMRIGAHVWPGYEPLFLARRAGLLDEKDFRLVEISSASESARAFRNEALEAAALTLDEVLYLLQDGKEPVILFVMDESNGADAVVARDGAKSLAGLKGKRIAVEAGAVGTYTLTRALQHAGFTLNDVTLVYLPIDQHVAAFQAGKVDALVTYEPARTKILALGAVELFNSSMIPGEIVDVLVVRRDYLEKHPGRAAALRTAWFAALERMRQSPAESIAFMAAREQVTAAEFEASLRGLRFPDEEADRAMLDGHPPKLLEPAERLKTVMREAGLLQKDTPLMPIFDRARFMKPSG